MCRVPRRVISYNKWLKTQTEVPRANLIPTSRYMTDLPTALSFLECFSEAEAWHLTVCDQQKVGITNANAMSTQKLRQTLPHVLSLRTVHVFIRPLLSNIIFLDLDDFWKNNKDLAEVIKLQPRALVRTSEGNYQAWYTFPQSLPAKQALWMTQSLNAHFQCGERSVKLLQQGRLPGSVNVKKAR